MPIPELDPMQAHARECPVLRREHDIEVLGLIVEQRSNRHTLSYTRWGY